MYLLYDDILLFCRWFTYQRILRVNEKKCMFLYKLHELLHFQLFFIKREKH